MSSCFYCFSWHSLWRLDLLWHTSILSSSQSCSLSVLIHTVLFKCDTFLASVLFVPFLRHTGVQALPHTHMFTVDTPVLIAAGFRSRQYGVNKSINHLCFSLMAWLKFMVLPCTKSQRRVPREARRLIHTVHEYHQHRGQFDTSKHSQFRDG